ncbi:hypothetical protein CEXT_166481 [Caerostris extrusa]|uniref:Uncharacterized protein n=1 Tax=Caerostris extrusa TaxID=172846 RepID=A0AAV4V5Y3_CAEEX|nr:hypothetical protein CEXT_166481 [Caerostris extrusa]
MSRKGDHIQCFMKRLSTGIIMHPAFLPYLGLWEALITVSSIGHHYCHARRLAAAFSSLHYTSLSVQRTIFKIRGGRTGNG